jgi:hypothetical protein
LLAEQIELFAQGIHPFQMFLAAKALHGPPFPFHTRTSQRACQEKNGRKSAANANDRGWGDLPKRRETASAS